MCILRLGIRALLQSVSSNFTRPTELLVILLSVTPALSAKGRPLSASFRQLVHAPLALPWLQHAQHPVQVHRGTKGSLTHQASPARCNGPRVRSNAAAPTAFPPHGPVDEGPLQLGANSAVLLAQARTMPPLLRWTPSLEGTPSGPPYQLTHAILASRTAKPLN